MISTSSALQFGPYWSAWFKRLRWVTHPITIFVFLQIVWLAITLIWVIWFVGEREAISKLAAKFGREYFDPRLTITILVVGCVLLGVLLVGTILLFVFGQRQSYLARQQRTFVSSVTHELKSPLASLQLAFETMNAHRLDEATSRRLSDMIQTDIDRLRRLVDQILVAGRLDKGILMFDEEHQQVHMPDLIQRIGEKLSYLDPNLGQRLVVHCPPTLTLKASRSALTLIVNNLVENAIKYSPKGSEVVITAERSPTDILISVQDQGIGLDLKDRRRIFRMFHRSDTAIKKAIPGTGLGLYIVKSAVRMLGGRVWAESLGAGQGSTFYVSLPLEREAQDHHA